MTTAAAHAPVSLDPMSRSLVDLVAAQDPDVAALMAAEAERQSSTLELIASENQIGRAHV
jgi:glycine/serine hydroxymethyltransferase